jgi:multicomponent Na+:H+ antiporter subunit E
MIYYLIVFTWELIKSNLDVARRVLTPSLPINPGIVKFKTKLTTDYSKMVLANSITLTPGTLSIDIVDDTFYVHWIDVKTTDPEEAFVEIAETFEKILLKIF